MQVLLKKDGRRADENGFIGKAMDRKRKEIEGGASGMSIQQAVADVASSPFVNPSIREGFKQIDSDIRTGISVSDAFERFAAAYDTADTRDDSAATAMQSEVGGSEAKVINLIAENIRERVMLRKEMKTLFADTELMATAMDILPFLLIALLYFFANGLIKPFFESAGMTVLFCAIMSFTLAGSYVIRRQLKKARRGDV